MRAVLLSSFLFFFSHFAVAADYCLLEFENEAFFPGSRIEGLITCSNQKMQDYNWGTYLISPQGVLGNLKRQGDQILTSKGNIRVGSSSTESPFPADLYTKFDEAEQSSAVPIQEKKFCLVRKTYSERGFPEARIAKGSEYRVYCDPSKADSITASNEASDDFATITDYMQHLGYRLDGKIDVDPVRDTGYSVTRKYLVFLSN